MQTELEIKALYSYDEMYPAVELQRVYWGDDLESVIPAHMLFSLATNGGHVIAALDGGRMVGLLVGFLGMDDLKGTSTRPAMASLHIASKRMVVLPEYRNHGLAYQLKLAQRDIAMRQAVRLVTWTFDPLLSLNAHFNIRKLGAVSSQYLVNYYGTSNPGGLSTLGSSDRLFVEWWVTHRRVKERVNAGRGALKLSQYLDGNTAILNPTTSSTDGIPWPSERTGSPTTSMALLEVPLIYPKIVAEDETLAIAWREHSRAAFLTLFGMGYGVTDFIRETHEGRDRGFYLLSHGDMKFDGN